MNPDIARETYMRVIEATVTSLRDELAEKNAGEGVMESLEMLKQRWEARLTQTHDFSEDPSVKVSTTTSRGGGGAGGKKGGNRNSSLSSNSKKDGNGGNGGGAKSNMILVPNSNKKKNKNSAGGASSSSRNGVMSVTNLTNNDDEDDDKKLLPTVPRLPPDDRGTQQPLPKRARANSPEAPKKVIDEHPERRILNNNDAASIDNHREELDSDDSDVENDDSDEEAENLVLAQHDKVKKGSKWKIILRDGIVAIRGREYLFEKATCDLDF